MGTASLMPSSSHWKMIMVLSNVKMKSDIIEELYDNSDLPLHGPGQENILTSRQILHVRKRANTFGDKEEKRAEEIFIQQCKENIEQGNIEQDILNDKDEIFVSNKRARYRVPKTFSSANFTQKTKSTKCSESNT